MNIVKPYWIILISACMFIQDVSAKKIHNRHFKFSITLPDGMCALSDTMKAAEGNLYFDTTAGIVLMISSRESKFKTVDDYMNCSIEQLEQRLKDSYGDPALKLISCNRSVYYPDKINLLHFRVSVLPFEYNTYMMYFIHHRHKDVQISFTYKQETEQKSQAYIDAVMRTLRLRKVL